MQLFPHAFPVVQILQQAWVGSTDHSICEPPPLSLTRCTDAVELALVVLKARSETATRTRVAIDIYPRYALRRVG
jgi:hypothetical protein